MSGALRHFWTWIAILALVALVQWAIPITSDEAYFVSWGQDFRWGYYDHPPLPGWISWLIWRLDDLIGLTRHGVSHRIFSGLLGLSGLALVALRFRQLSSEVHVDSALLTIVVVPGFLLLFSLYLNDSFVAITGLWFLLAVDQAFRAERRVWVAMLIAALAFDLVLLTKYNGALIYLGMVGAFLTWPAGRRFLFGRFVLISLLALPAFLLHLAWNYQNCGINLAFNFGFRASHATGWGPAWVVLTLLLMAGPVSFWILLRLLRGKVRPVGFFGRILLGTVSFMLAISLWRGEFGVNWGAPLGFLTLLALAEDRELRDIQWPRRLALVLSAALLVPLAGTLISVRTGLIDAETIFGASRGTLVKQQFDLADGSLIDAVRPLAKDRVLVAQEYGIAAIFENAGFTDVTVFSRSVFGRNQDLETDFQALDGRDMLVLPNGGTLDVDEISELFDSAQLVTVNTARQSYQVILGTGFYYETYRRLWIAPVISALYAKSRFPYGACLMDNYGDGLKSE